MGQGRPCGTCRSAASCTDHPHACGENFERSRFYRPLWRTIPTRVGRTDYMPPGVFQADHPHACEENAEFTGDFDPDTGPSPRVWGELCESVLQSCERRTMPTRVGKTILVNCTRSVTTDHPHACGENLSSGSFTSGAGGPSPRVWGEPRHSPTTHALSRTIPTRVGRTRAAQSRTDTLCGPSPRVWGEQ